MLDAAMRRRRTGVNMSPSAGVTRKCAACWDDNVNMAAVPMSIMCDECLHFLRCISVRYKAVQVIATDLVINWGGCDAPAVLTA